MSITACLVPVRDKPHRNINTRSVCLSPKIDARQHICILTERCDDLRITNKPETRRAEQLFFYDAMFTSPRFILPRQK